MYTQPPTAATSTSTAKPTVWPRGGHLMQRPARVHCFGADFRPLSSCRGPQAALKCAYRGDRVDPGLICGSKSARRTDRDAKRAFGLDGPSVWRENPLKHLAHSVPLWPGAQLAAVASSPPRHEPAKGQRCRVVLERLRRHQPAEGMPFDRRRLRCAAHAAACADQSFRAGGVQGGRSLSYSQAMASGLLSNPLTAAMASPGMECPCSGCGVMSVKRRKDHWAR